MTQSSSSQEFLSDRRLFCRWLSRQFVRSASVWQTWFLDNWSQNHLQEDLEMGIRREFCGQTAHIVKFCSIFLLIKIWKGWNLHIFVRIWLKTQAILKNMNSDRFRVLCSGDNMKSDKPNIEVSRCTKWLCSRPKSSKCAPFLKKYVRFVIRSWNSNMSLFFFNKNLC